MPIDGDDLQLERRIDELIERGLERYGAGDLEGAMSEWKHALALDPDNQRAADYVSYIEKHYEIVAHSGGNGAPVAPPEFELATPSPLEEMSSKKLDSQDLDAYESIEIVAESGLEMAADVAEPMAGAEPTSSPHSSDGFEEMGKTRDEAVSKVESDLDDGWDVDQGWALDLVPSGSGVARESPFEDEGATEDSSLDLEVADPTREVEPASLGRSQSLDLGLPFPHGVDLDDSDAVDEDGLELTPTGLTSAKVGLPPDEEPTAGRGHSGGRVDTSPGSIDLGDATIPGGQDLPDIGSHKLSEEALAALSSSPRFVEESTSEFTTGRPGTLGSSFELSELDSLDAGARREDDRILSGSEGLGTGARELAFRDNGTRQAETAGPPGELDEEMTVERGAAQWRRRRRPPTQDPGIDAHSVSIDESLLSFEDATGELDVSKLAGTHGALAAAHSAVHVDDDVSLPGTAPRDLDSSLNALEAVQDQLLSAIDSGAPAGEGDDARTERRVLALIDRAQQDLAKGELRAAAIAAGMAIDEQPDSPVAQKCVHERQEPLSKVFLAYVGDLSRVPCMTRSLSDIPISRLDHRSAFLLSRIDGALSLDDIIDVSGMSKFEALQQLAKLILRGLLEVR